MFLSGSTRHTALIFDAFDHTVDLYQVCSNDDLMVTQMFYIGLYRKNKKTILTSEVTRLRGFIFGM